MRHKAQTQSSVAEQPPEGYHHYETLGEVPWDIQKYFQQRHKIFSAYDKGIWLTDDAWFGVTPEPVARKIALHLSRGVPTEKTVVIDAFAGVGGNAIAFALSGRWMQVHAIENDPLALQCAKHNAKVYGVGDLITWHHGDCFQVLQSDLAHLGNRAVIFGSPPWGGTAYRSETIFDLNKMQPYPLHVLVSNFSKLTRDIVLYLPRSADLHQLAKLENNSRNLTVIHYCMDGASKALCAYLGEISPRD